RGRGGGWIGRHPDGGAGRGGEGWVGGWGQGGGGGGGGWGKRGGGGGGGRGRGGGYPAGLVTVSIGVAEFAPGRGPAVEDVLVAADRALYRAKAAGRNQVALGEQ